MRPGGGARHTAHERRQRHQHRVGGHQRQWRSPAGRAPRDADEHRTRAHRHCGDLVIEGEAAPEQCHHRNRGEQPGAERHRPAVKPGRRAHRLGERSRCRRGLVRRLVGTCGARGQHRSLDSSRGLSRTAPTARRLHLNTHPESAAPRRPDGGRAGRREPASWAGEPASRDPWRGASAASWRRRRRLLRRGGGACGGGCAQTGRRRSKGLPRRVTITSSPAATRSIHSPK